VWRAKRAARELIADPGLSAQRIARLQRISLRTLQRAFEAEGASLMRWLRDERLERSAALLVDASHRGHSIAEIAASLGFRDIPAFCRSFKRRFGESPSAWRATKAAAGGR
jgi:AraC-like DNA-binding protein